MKRIFSVIVIMLLISCNNNPGDVYLGKWADNNFQVTITSNGSNYIIISQRVNGSETQQFSGVCENGIMKITERNISLTYVKDGGYLLSGDTKLFKK